MTIIQGFDLDTACVNGWTEGTALFLTVIVSPGKAKTIKLKAGETDYAAASTWLSGRTQFAVVPPAPQPPPPAAASVTPRVVRDIRAWIEQTAQGRIVGGVQLYAGFNEAVMLGVKKDVDALVPWAQACWQHGFQVVADVAAGRRVMPTTAALVAELPTLVWPT